MRVIIAPIAVALIFLAVIVVRRQMAPPDEPQALTTSVGVDESSIPMGFGLRISNSGTAPAHVDDVRLHVTAKHVLFDDEAPATPCECAILALHFAFTSARTGLGSVHATPTRRSSARRSLIRRDVLTVADFDVFRDTDPVWQALRRYRQIAP